MPDNEVSSSMSRVGLILKRDLLQSSSEDFIFLGMLSGVIGVVGGTVALAGVGLGRVAEKLPPSVLKKIAVKAARPIAYGGVTVALAGAGGVGVCIAGVRENKAEHDSITKLIMRKIK